MMAFLDESSPLWLVTLMQTVRGIGVSALIGPLNSWGMSQLPQRIVMDGSASFAAVRQACASLGTAVMMLIIALLSVEAMATGASVAFAYQMAFAFSAVCSLVVLVVALWKVRA